MSESEFASEIVMLLETGRDTEHDLLTSSFYVWAWRRAREIHELKLRQELESRPLVVVKMERP